MLKEIHEKANDGLVQLLERGVVECEAEKELIGLVGDGLDAFVAEVVHEVLDDGEDVGFVSPDAKFSQVSVGF